MTALSGWGRYPRLDSAWLAPPDAAGHAEALARASGGIARGNGRAYGDAAIGTGQTISTTHLDRYRAFDPQTGVLTVEAGVLLADIIATFLPQGFFPKVVPGTRFVSVGGAIAADVHGKNHHRDGGFGDHVVSLLLASGGGAVIRASRDENADIFFATIGGMGLTGTILEATIVLRKVETGWIRQRTVVAPDLAAAMAVFDNHDDVTYSVAWIDCLAKGPHLGRSLIYLAEHAERAELDERAARCVFPPIAPARLSVPLDFPGFALNPLSVSAFNALYYANGARKAGDPFLVAADPYFFPLDGIGDWNRIYGRRGFVQHQCVLPLEKAPSAIAHMLERITERGDASFLAVLKKLGPAKGMMSFPFPGYTLALDFPMGPGLLGFLDDLDRLVVDAGGRLYLAKDARQSRSTFEAGYAGLSRFREVRRTLDPNRHVNSHLAERLGI